MHKFLTTLFTAILVVILSVVYKCYQSEIQNGTILQEMILKLIVRDIYPAQGSEESLLKVRTMINSQGSVNGTAAANQTIVNIRIPGVGDQLIPVRLYMPTKDSSSVNLKPVLIWFHGGGFILGNYTNEDSTCAKIVQYTDFMIVNVDYRLAPENQFPAGVNDGVVALQWTKNNIEKYGGNPEQIYISGESAGGNIASAVTAINYDSERTNKKDIVDIKGLFVLYPCLEHGVYRDSHFRYSNTFAMLTLKQMIYFWTLYLGDQNLDCQDYRACPMRTPKNILQKFPPTLIVLAKHDILLDEGLNFGELLKEQQISVTTKVYNNVFHGFFAKPVRTTEEQTIEICQLISAMIH